MNIKNSVVKWPIIDFLASTVSTKKMKEIKHITNEHIEVISSTWALKLNRPNLYYKNILRDVRDGLKEWELLPYFIVEALRGLEYKL